jgi:hypothetical protein
MVLSFQGLDEAKWKNMQIPHFVTQLRKNQRQWIDERNLMFVAIANPMVDMF